MLENEPEFLKKIQDPQQMHIRTFPQCHIFIDCQKSVFFITIKTHMILFSCCHYYAVGSFMHYRIFYFCFYCFYFNILRQAQHHPCVTYTNCKCTSCKSQITHWMVLHPHPQRSCTEAPCASLDAYYSFCTYLI